MDHLRLGAVVAAAALAAVGGGAANGAAAGTSTVGAQAAAAAVKELGVPYAWGHDAPRSGFDAAGLVVWAFGREGVTLPHYTPALWLSGRHVARKALRVGDLVFFDGRAHVGIYLGHGAFVHAPHTGAVVRVNSLVMGFYGRHYDGAVRIRR